MPHPTQNYIKFTVLRNWPSETVDTINYMLAGCRFPEIAVSDFDVLVQELEIPKGFNPENETHEPTIACFREHQVYSMWMGRQEAVDAVALAELPHIRETVQLLLMGRFDAKEISARIRPKFKKNIPPKAIEAYRHYFWNPDVLGMKDLRTLLWADPMRDAYLAATWGSKNQALFRAGFNPTIDGKRALKEAHRNLYMRLESTRIMPDNKDTARTVATLAKELVTVHNALYGEGAGVEDMMKELQRFVMERNAGNVVPIHQLAPKGNYSGSGQKEG